MASTWKAWSRPERVGFEHRRGKGQPSVLHKKRNQRKLLESLRLLGEEVSGGWVDPKGVSVVQEVITDQTRHLNWDIIIWRNPRRLVYGDDVGASVAMVNAWNPVVRGDVQPSVEDHDVRLGVVSVVAYPWMVMEDDGLWVESNVVHNREIGI
ncbi:unnamed protein product [Gadus morhua 'NCC']